MKLLDELDKLPPILCRILAVHHRRGRQPVLMSISEISQRSGLGIGKVKRLALRRSWAGVGPEIFDQFTAGCGLTRGKMAKKLKFLRDEFKKPVPLAYLETIKPYLRTTIYRHLNEKL